MPFRILALMLALLATPVAAQDRVMLDRALEGATATFDAAARKLSTTELGVDVIAYGDALRLQRFKSALWGGSVTVGLTIRDKAEGSCSRFAAFVRVPPQDGAVPLVLCPQFFASGTDELRELTILHEMVHVVAGTDECQAMAFAAAVQKAATGSFTPVTAYWKASGCAGTRYTLPE